MNNWTIRKQITALSGISVGFLLLVAAASFAAAVLLNMSFKQFNGATQRTERLNLILEDLLEANTAAVAFEYSADPRFATAFRSEVAEILEVSSIGDTVRNSTDEFAALMVQIHDRTEQYISQFEALEGVVANKSRLVEELSQSGVAVNEALAEIGTRASIDGQPAGVKQVTSAMQAFSLSRLYLERYIRTGAQSDLTTFEDRRAEAETAFGRAVRLLGGDRFQPLVDAAQTELTAYFELKSRLFEDLARRDQTSSDLLFSSGAMGILVEDATDAASIFQAEIWAVARKHSGLLAAFKAVVVFAALTILFMAARRISTRIRQDIERTLSDMNTLASGTLDFKIAGTDLATEIGDMARGLEVFRTNAAEARKLQEQLRLKEKEEVRMRALQTKKDQAADAERQAAMAREREAIIRDLSSGLGGVVTAAANGDFSQRIDRRFGQADLDEIVMSVNALVESVEDSIKETARVLGSMADGDLTIRMQGSHRGLFHNLQKAIDETALTLGEVIREISHQCDDIGKSSLQMESQANDLSSRAETQAAALEETSAAMKELSNSVQSGAAAARKSSTIAKTAKQHVSEAGEVVGASISAMTDIKGASEKIKDIVAVMDSIAYQTNLLALNASVEAARAGEAGKGFAVVATEVRALAQRSGDASRDIKALIEETVSQVERGVGLVERTGSTLKDVVEGVESMSATMDGLTVRAQDQASGVSEVTSAVLQMDSITQKNAALADDSRETARNLSGKMDIMQALIGRFRVDHSATHMSQIAAE
ncbi:methyl-accepting chemotaxis protein [Boseongicola aestuarii]|uniref:Methyl-accepting chemotaxis protein II n=1 Tax=Boseongicola aestuarii TaxID=1470561 RepID=A0A238J228_9RHOB|nr:methyl-accepting chemotaxis protein [Boseongicola aestuarii]SMX24789.1 Methyl-accepting chemotaxis protein II [Boseongicola aestuarii]